MPIPEMAMASETVGIRVNSRSTGISCTGLITGAAPAPRLPSARNSEPIVPNRRTTFSPRCSPASRGCTSRGRTGDRVTTEPLPAVRSA